MSSLDHLVQSSQGIGTLSFDGASSRGWCTHRVEISIGDTDQLVNFEESSPLLERRRIARELGLYKSVA